MLTYPWGHGSSIKFIEPVYPRRAGGLPSESPGRRLPNGVALPRTLSVVAITSKFTMDPGFARRVQVAPRGGEPTTVILQLCTWACPTWGNRACRSTVNHKDNLIWVPTTSLYYEAFDYEYVKLFGEKRNLFTFRGKELYRGVH